MFSSMAKNVYALQRLLFSTPLLFSLLLFLLYFSPLLPLQARPQQATLYDIFTLAHRTSISIVEYILIQKVK